jgi:hypothetical protein
MSVLLVVSGEYNMKRVRVVREAPIGTRRADIIQDGDIFKVELFEEGHFVESVIPKDQETFNISRRHVMARGLADAWVSGEYNFLQE